MPQSAVHRESDAKLKTCNWLWHQFRLELRPWISLGGTISGPGQINSPQLIAAELVLISSKADATSASIEDTQLERNRASVVRISWVNTPAE